jgi:hypothetical protein
VKNHPAKIKSSFVFDLIHFFKVKFYVYVSPILSEKHFSQFSIFSPSVFLFSTLPKFSGYATFLLFFLPLVSVQSKNTNNAKSEIEQLIPDP